MRLAKGASALAGLVAASLFLLEQRQLRSGLHGTASSEGRQLMQQEGELDYSGLAAVVRVAVPGAEMFIEGEVAEDRAGQAVMQEDVGVLNLFNFLTNLISVLLQFCVAAFMYNSFKSNRVTSWPPMPAGDFPDGMFACTADLQSCLCGLFCPIVQASKNAHESGLRNFWPTLLICAVLFMWPTWLGLAFFAAFRFALRTELRRAGGLEANPWDCVAVCCCMCCSISQEARYVNYARGASSGQGASTVAVGPRPGGEAVGAEVGSRRGATMGSLCNSCGSSVHVQRAVVSIAVGCAVVLGILALVEITTDDPTTFHLICDVVENLLAVFAAICFWVLVGPRCCAPCCFGEEMPDVPPPCPCGECSWTNAKLLDYPLIICFFSFTFVRSFNVLFLSSMVFHDLLVALWVVKAVFVVLFVAGSCMGCTKGQLLCDKVATGPAAGASTGPVGQSVGVPVGVRGVE